VDAETDASRAVFWQLAFWQPDREIIITSKRQVAPRIRARIAILELAVITMDRKAAVHAAGYPCTYPECHSPLWPTAAQLANHRFAAHGIRSTNEESIARQQRRDRQRFQQLGTAPEYIDRARIRKTVGAKFPAPAGVAISDGPLNPGDLNTFVSA
jgi:hypothetical protein